MTIPEAFQTAVQRHQAGRLAEAEALYRRILAAQPNHAGALHLLGVLAHQAGRNELAVEWIRQAIALDPNNPDAHSNLGEACRAMGRFDEAVAAFRLALELKPDSPEIHNNLGNALREQGQFDKAIAACRRALELQPGLPQAYNNLGNILRVQGRLDEAVAAYRRALELKPDSVETHNNLGNTLRERGQPDEAVAAFHRALQLQPNFPQTHNDLGNALMDRGQLDEAVAAFRRALELHPDDPEALNGLGNALKDQGALDESITSFRRALQIKPDYVPALSNLVFTLNYHPGYDKRAISEERQNWNRRIGDPRKPFVRKHANGGAPERRLRVGYVSSDFRDHVVGRNMMPLFACHDGRNFEILCYSGVLQPDMFTEAFRRRAHQWRSTAGVPDEALAERIRQDGVDILVDLSQHTAGNRLPMFARKPAPVQASFAGYPESTGLETIEYRISDRYLQAARAEDAAGGKERVCLIDSFWCYDPCGAEAEVNGLPARESGSISFGCLNNFCKINDRALGLWARVLGRVTNSRLVLQTPAGSHRRRTLETLEREGVDARRVEFLEYRPRREYLELYHRLDIVLDTFPYNGHTTSLDALWMGVPVVSLAGEAPVSRAGLSQLSNLGLPELAARSESEYVSIAGSLARDLPRLMELRSTLRDRMKASVLMDAPRFARQVEQAYREMWRDWCAGKTKDEG